MRKKMYICDGEDPDCRKSYCSFNGTGDCKHTSNRRHARYEPPRKWRVVEGMHGETALFERERPWNL